MRILDFAAQLRVPALCDIERWQAELDWQPFRAGVDAVRLHGSADAGSSAVLLRYLPGAGVPRHRHVGHEHILVLAGSQTDDNGRASAGTFIVNRPGSEHSVISEDGCIVLVMYEQPVRFVGGA